jgi:tRNA modification GTPase
MNRGALGDTIAAISTPLGAGGIGVIRISGPQALTIAQRIFNHKGGSSPFRSHRFYLGEIIRPEDQKPLDEVLLVFMRRPKTYTREDLVEIQCHGGALVLQEILTAVLRSGARLAEPGEFTKRAFLNGRIDLTQAEAVIDLIHSQTRKSLEIANHQRSGKLAAEVRQMKGGLMDILTLLEASVDFPEEEIPEISPLEIRRRLQNTLGRLDALNNTYLEGKVYREGIAAVIIGKPNVGKSSLLNALLREERAIVTALPGTTRDVIEETVNIGGIPVRLMDTAGLRPVEDAIEKEGVKRTHDRLSQADLILWVLDGSEPLSVEDWAILPQVGSKKAILAVNKNDLPQRIHLDDLLQQIPGASSVAISALCGSGMDRLQEAIRRLVLNGKTDSLGEPILTNLRHKLAAEAAREALSQAIQALGQDLSWEFIILDLREALEALRSILGETAPEDVLDRIFEQFCIGK